MTILASTHRPHSAIGRVSLISIFMVFLQIGAFSFGGGLSGPVYHEVVERSGWHAALEKGLAPIATDLIAVVVLAIGQMAGAGPLWWSVAGACAPALGLRPRSQPLLLADGFLVFAAARYLRTPTD